MFGIKTFKKNQSHFSPTPRRIAILLLLMFFSKSIDGGLFSQEWIFNLKMNFRPVSWFTYANVGYGENYQGLFFNFKNAKGGKLVEFFPGFYTGGVGHIQEVGTSKNIFGLFHPKHFEGEVSVDLYKYSKRLQFGLGWASHQGALYAGLLSNSKYSISDTTLNLHTIVFDGILFLNQQIYAFADYQLGKENGILRHHFIGGLSLNVMSQSNARSNNRVVNQFFDNQNNFQIETRRNAKHVYPSLILKYELEFRNKKGRNILGLNISYNQGLMTVYEHSVTGSMTTGESFTSLSKSRGSGFRVGISKSFNLKGVQ